MATTPHAPRPTDKVKVAVLGTGSLARSTPASAELAAAGSIEFTGVMTSSANERANSPTSTVKAFASVAEAAAASDALSIVTPTTTHFDLARTLLQQGNTSSSRNR